MKRKFFPAPSVYFLLMFSATKTVFPPSIDIFYFIVSLCFFLFFFSLSQSTWNVVSPFQFYCPLLCQIVGLEFFDYLVSRCKFIWYIGIASILTFFFQVKSNYGFTFFFFSILVGANFEARTGGENGNETSGAHSFQTHRIARRS